MEHPGFFSSIGNMLTHCSMKQCCLFFQKDSYLCGRWSRMNQIVEKRNRVASYSYVLSLVKFGETVEKATDHKALVMVTIQGHYYCCNCIQLNPFFELLCPFKLTFKYLLCMSRPDPHIRYNWTNGAICYPLFQSININMHFKELYCI